MIDYVLAVYTGGQALIFHALKRTSAYWDAKLLQDNEKNNFRTY